jgi:hypothetical protein
VLGVRTWLLWPVLCAEVSRPGELRQRYVRQGLWIIAEMRGVHAWVGLEHVLGSMQPGELRA